MNALVRSVRTLCGNDTARGIAATLSILSVLAMVEGTGVLPFSGAATPMYGPAPVTKTSDDPADDLSSGKASKSKTAAKRAEQRKAAAAKKSSSSSALKPGPAVTSKWTGRECSKIDPKITECRAKMDALLDGDMACMHDLSCQFAVEMHLMSSACRKTNFYCEILAVMRWSYSDLMPECRDLETASCRASWDYLHGGLDAKETKCLKSPACRGILSQMRDGDLACLRYTPCADAVRTMTSRDFCAGAEWCKGMKDMVAFVDARKDSCLVRRDASCTAGVAKYVTRKASSQAYKVDCDTQEDCYSDVSYLSDDALRGYDTTCFLWSACRERARLAMNYCYRGAEECARRGAILAFYTQKRPECAGVTSAACSKDLEKAIADAVAKAK